MAIREKMELIPGPQTILAIETSADDTGVAILRNEKVLSNEVYSQIPDHSPHGGIVPELAARLHIDKIDNVMDKALIKAGVNVEDLTMIAFTRTPGIANCLQVGMLAAKSLAQFLDIPLVPVDHLDGHIYSPFINKDPKEIKYPFLAVQASGGHTFIVNVTKPFHYEILMGTSDDSLGETLDKAGKMFGLGYPGGPKIDVLMRNFEQSIDGENKYTFKSPEVKDPRYLSFSGFKSQLVRYHDKMKFAKKTEVSKVLGSFGITIMDYFISKIDECVAKVKATDVVLVGGVAANKYLQSMLQERQQTFKTHIASNTFIGDNGAMIGYAAYAYLAEEMLPEDMNNLLMDVVPVSPLNTKVRKTLSLKSARIPATNTGSKEGFKTSKTVEIDKKTKTAK